jgi:hypothetical protein
VRAVPVIAATAAVIAGLLLARYAYHYFFLYDDFGLFFVADTTPLAKILTTPLIGFYRPLPFVLLKAEMGVFGWNAPAALAACLLAVHAANATLLALLTRDLLRPQSGERKQTVEREQTAEPPSISGGSEATGGKPALLAFALFLISPWATEGFLWASGVFDVVATFGVLLAVLGARRATTAGVGMAAIGAAIAVFSKESGVMVPALVLIAMVIDRPIGRLKTPTALMTIGATLLPLAAYVLTRSSVIGLTKGAYGDFTSLWSPTQAPNVLTYLRAVVWVPMRPPWPPYATLHEGLLRQAFVFLVLPLALWQLARQRHHTRVLAGCLIAACLATVPVMWFGLGPDTTVGGRFAYSPAVWLVVPLAIGVASLCDWLTCDWLSARVMSARTTAPWRQALAAVPCVLAFAYFGASFVYQLDMWTLASRVSQSVMAQVERYRGRSGIALEIQNMPSVSQEGPYILKGYAFHCYRHGHAPPMPPVKAQMQTIKLAWQGQPVSSPSVDPFSDYLYDPPDGLTAESIRLTLAPPAQPAQP